MKTNSVKGVFVFGALLIFCMGWLTSAAPSKAKEAKKTEKKPATITGKWQGTYTREGNTLPVGMDFVQKGDAVTGTINTGDNTLEIKKGSYDAKAAALNLEVSTGEGQRYTVSGKLDGDMINGTWKGEDENGTFEIKRVKTSSEKSQ